MWGRQFCLPPAFQPAVWGRQSLFINVRQAGFLAGLFSMPLLLVA
jgi:hypothetical protein